MEFKIEPSPGLEIFINKAGNVSVKNFDDSVDGDVAVIPRERVREAALHLLALADEIDGYEACRDSELEDTSEEFEPVNGSVPK